MKKTTAYSVAIVRHAIQNFNKEDTMCPSLHEELGFKIFGEKEERSTASEESNVCKKCGATLRGVLTGRRISISNANGDNGEFTFIIITYCPHCDKKPIGQRKNTRRKR
ncbi:MAG: hypothetical protein NUV61_02650 [Candidatus Azambacteria bacterium]|nr:hypothetical protein [Candidatus Azambacteria bacterium]